MDIDTLTIGEAKTAIETGKQIEAALGGKSIASRDKDCAETAPSSEGLNIVILDRGFVWTK